MSEVNVFKRTASQEDEKPGFSLKSLGMLFSMPGLSDIARVLVFMLISRVNVLWSAFPFAPALFALCPLNKMYIGLLAVTAGILTGGVLLPDLIKYLIACIIIGVVTVIYNKYSRDETHDIHDKPYLGALVCFLGLFVSGVLSAVANGLLMYDVLALVVESVLCGVSYIIFLTSDNLTASLKKRTRVSQTELTAICLTAAICVLGVDNLPLFGGQVANVICILGMLITAYNIEVGSSSGVAITLGIILGLDKPDLLRLAGLFGFMSVCGGSLKNLGKFGTAFGLAGAYFLAVIYSPGIGNIVNVYTLLAAVALFLAIPKKTHAAMREFFAKTLTNRPGINVKDFITMRLTGIADAFSALSGAFCDLAVHQKKYNIENPATVFDETTDRVCNDCSMREHCWQKEYGSSVDAMNKMLDKIEEKGYADVLDAPTHFAKRCLRMDRLVCTLNHCYENFRMNALHVKQRAKDREMVYQQYNSIAGILSTVASEMQQGFRFVPEKEKALAAELDKHGIRTAQVCVVETYAGKMEIYVEGTGKTKELDAAKIAQITADYLDETISVDNGFSENMIRLFTQTGFTLQTGASRLKKAHEDECGDNYSCVDTNDGQHIIILSDGMGSGRDASRQSSQVISLLERFLRAGFNKSTAIGFINSVMCSRSDDEAVATVDLTVIDLASAKCEFVKIGSSVSFVKTDDGIEIIRSNSLPAGIFSDVDMDVVSRQLNAGDVIAVVSDGVYEAVPGDDAEKDRWFISRLHTLCDYDDMQYASEQFLDMVSAETGREPSDDMTVIFARVELR